MSINPASTESYWMPFTANRDFKKNPRVFVRAEGHYYYTADGRKIVRRLFLGCGPVAWVIVTRKLSRPCRSRWRRWDYSLGFQAGSDKVFELSDRITAMAPEGFQQSLFHQFGFRSPPILR